MKAVSALIGGSSYTPPPSRHQPRKSLNAPCSGCAGRTEINETLIAPAFAAWDGKKLSQKPWEYPITAAIPHLETIEPLRIAIEVLRCQTVRPYILIVDTGSSAATRAELEQLRAEDLEIHFVAAHAYRHASEPVAMALDVAQALCRSEFLFHTHADCFLRRFDFLADMVKRCGASNPVIGYRMSPREGTDDWRAMVSHTATILHMPTIRAIGASWSMQRMNTHHGVPWKINGIPGGWPDTETGFGYSLRDAGITPDFIGDDINRKRQVDENIDHVRSYAGSKIYSEKYHAKAVPWMEAAVAEARARIAEAKARRTSAAQPT